MPHNNVSPQLIAGGNISPSTFVKLSTAADNTALQAGANMASRPYVTMEPPESTEPPVKGKKKE